MRSQTGEQNTIADQHEVAANPCPVCGHHTIILVQPVEDAEPERGPTPIEQIVQLMAEDFANPKLTLDDIAEAGGVSRRQAELLCARHLGRNPIALLRTIRLFHARNALVIGQRPATRVQHVASGVGYRHQGRFAKHYAHEYGEPPSATLARKPVDSFPGLTDADGPVVITRIAAILGRSSRAATDSASSLKR